MESFSRSAHQLESDGCSWFPDLWIGECCIAHDYGASDIEFLTCIAKESSFLGPMAFIFAGIIVTGMALGRPVRELWKKILRK